MRVLLAVSKPKVRYALNVLLQQQPWMKIVGEAVDVAQMFVRALEAHPHLVLVDWDLPDLLAGDSIAILRKSCPGVQVVALCRKRDVGQAAMNAGADAIVSTAESPECLLATIRGCFA